MTTKKKTPKALLELYELIKTPDHTDYFPDKNRKELLDKWISRWVCEEESAQLVMDKKYLSSDFFDTIKYRLMQDLADKLIEENCGEFQVEERKVTAKLWGLKRK